MDLKAQEKLLRVIQEKTVRPVGSTREYKTSFRLVAAASTELETMVSEGSFLPDLFERLNILTVTVPPLRERKEDIELLVAYFCSVYEQETSEKRSFLKRTVRYLENYDWPRNVRELENTVKRICIDSNVEKIAPEHLDAKFFSEEGAAPATTDLKSKVDAVIKRELQDALATSSSNRDAARKLGIPESSLRSMVTKFFKKKNHRAIKSTDVREGAKS